MEVTTILHKVSNAPLGNWVNLGWWLQIGKRLFAPLPFPLTDREFHVKAVF